MRRWFTLFFIPLIPLNARGEYVECSTCKHAFDTSALSAPTIGKLRDELAYAMREATVALLRADSAEAADPAAAIAVSNFLGQNWRPQDLNQDLQQLDPQHLDARLTILSGTLNEVGKERFLETCCQVAGTTGAISSQARTVIEHIGAGLLMTQAHVRGIVDHPTEQAKPQPEWVPDDEAWRGLEPPT
jgi:hypothetical protein